MPKTIHAEGAPAAVGPYVHAVRVGDLLFTSGQVGLDPATGKLVPGGIEAETQRALDNLAAILSAAGTGFDRVVKASVFLVDMDDFAAMNRVYASVFGDTRPARTTVAVSRLPVGARVEIDVVASV
ncbi:MAG TPA: Rid family detoxifying hydrolase [Candidatus Polarisedimenticolaceae bacterium]|nr:Rid family detoxifying hydrolase [Candidatus Polarisedimenticolaceae bacterium]